MLPTPASSTDLKGQEQNHVITNLQFQTIELPPPAILGESSRPTSAEKEVDSPENMYRVQPSETVKSRRRSTMAQSSQITKESGFALPPPPTRSRKIIQMKPQQEEMPSTPIAEFTLNKAPGSKKGQIAEPAVITKKKQASATSAAGRKIARKTAHSLIERRRRSKMNEEFSVLKGLIPACSGEMHKLAILQASIEYVRYLEDCVQKLQVKASQNNQPDEDSRQNTPTQPRTPTHRDLSFSPPIRSIPAPPLATRDRPLFPARPYTDASGDIEIADPEKNSPYRSAPSSVHQPSISPALAPEEHPSYHSGYSLLTHEQRHYSYRNSTTTSPAFGPHFLSYNISYARSNHSTTGSTLTSPVLNPQHDRDLDHEATAALLMLNKDPRVLKPAHSSSSFQSEPQSRRMSVKDLLTS